MNIAIVGSSGYIAGFLLQRFEKSVFVDKILKVDQNEFADTFLNLLEPEKFNYEVLDDIDYIVFTAAVSSPDKCASEFEFCWNINVRGTKYFISRAIDHGCKVLFFSSDAVFGNVAGRIYDENSETVPETPYGKMKKQIEDTFKNSSNFKAIRLSYVASAKDKFISYCLSCIRSKECADIYHPFYRNVIVVSDVVEVVSWLALHWNEYKSFSLNVAGRELVSRIRMADELNRLFDNQLKYTISFPGNEFYKNRPQITQMKSLFIHEYGILEDKTFTEKIKAELTGILD